MFIPFVVMRSANASLPKHDINKKKSGKWRSRRGNRRGKFCGGLIFRGLLCGKVRARPDENLMDLLNLFSRAVFRVLGTCLLLFFPLQMLFDLSFLEDTRRKTGAGWKIMENE